MSITNMLQGAGSTISQGFKTAGERIALGQQMLNAGQLTQSGYAQWVSTALNTLPEGERKQMREGLPANVQALLAKEGL